jgi:hypothetical protein
MKEIYRILKPGNGWAQCIELFFPYCLSDVNVPQDIGLKQVSTPMLFNCSFSGTLSNITVPKDFGSLAVTSLNR